MIDSAIEKSHVNVEQNIYRAVQEDDWLLEKYVGGIFCEKAFGSYSLKIENAMSYINPENPIIFRRLLNKNTKALYLDKSEYEILLPRNIENEIITIETVKILDYKTKMYTIEDKRVKK